MPEMCTKGPSLPMLSPPPMAKTIPILLQTMVFILKNRLILTPDMMAFISGTPEPWQAGKSKLVKKQANSDKTMQ